MAHGLDAAGRQVIRGMIDNAENDESIRTMIGQLLRYDGWDYQKNLVFVRELSAHGYPESAKHLAVYINR